MMMRLLSFVAIAVIGLMAAMPPRAQAGNAVVWHWQTLMQPCRNDCAFMVFSGQSVNTNVQDIYFKPIMPWNWSLDEGGIVGATASRRIATVFDMFDFEAELGMAKRFGNQQEGEFWGALYLRFTAFPWNNYLTTTLAISTGLNYATGISDFEKEHSGLNPPGGTHVLHYFSPELTFALPNHRDRQLVFRMHHRSGAYGVVSGAFSGATYMTVGVRGWF